MKKEIDLTGISKADKIEFLQKLQSKKYSLKQSGDQMPGMSFNRLESGLYKCDQTGEEKTRQEIEAMEAGFFLLVEIVSDLKQPPEGFHLINLQCANCLEALLQPLN